MRYIKYELPSKLKADNKFIKPKLQRLSCRDWKSDGDLYKPEGVDRKKLSIATRALRARSGDDAKAEADAKAGVWSSGRQEKINEASLPLVHRLSRALHVHPPEHVVTEATDKRKCAAGSSTRLCHATPRAGPMCCTALSMTSAWISDSAQCTKRGPNRSLSGRPRACTRIMSTIAHSRWRHASDIRRRRRSQLQLHCL